MNVVVPSFLSGFPGTTDVLHEEGVRNGGSNVTFSQGFLHARQEGESGALDEQLPVCLGMSEHQEPEEQEKRKAIFGSLDVTAHRGRSLLHGDL